MKQTFAALLLSVVTLGSSARFAHAHPFDAAPARHPVAPGFDRLAAAAESEAQVARAGLLLLAELNCAACHAAPATWAERLAPVSGPDLSAAGSRLSADAIARMISDPQQYKGGTRMPRLFTEKETDRVASIAEYLASLRQPVSASPEGDAARGGELYHSVGCVACHAPGQPPANLPAGQEVLTTATDSVPLGLARDYEPQALADFLRDPLRIRPAGRMPSLHLTAQEAADIARYLQQDRRAGSSVSKSSPERIAAGREFFAKQRCNACHTTGEKFPAPAAPALASLTSDRGCLAVSRASGTPRYELSAAQRNALALALRTMKSPPPEESAAQMIEWQMARLNCSACHVRGRHGGPEPARAQFFTVNDPGIESLGEMAHLPPLLDRVGRKLTPEWFAKILWGDDGAVRPYMNTRMPAFGRAQTEPLIALFEQADALAKPFQMDVSGLLGHQRSEPGRKLIGAGGLGCVSCHGLKDRKSLGPPVVRLTHTVQRLRPEYFKELLLDPQGTQPGTVMPPLFAGRKSADKDVETIWTYLKELDGQPLPEGLFSDADYELKPDATGRPIVLRSFVEGAGTHAIGVGFPGGLNATFDAKTCRWTQVWRGRFLDAMSNFQDRTMKPIKPLGTDVKALPPADGEREFRGYRLSTDGVPTFLYRRDGKDVDDTLRPASDGKAFERVVKVDGAEKKEVLSW